MAVLKTIALAQIHVGERARPIDEDHALAIAASMAERGLINPITVRATPAKSGGNTPYTLVAGGHRYRGAELNQWADIDVIVIEADSVEAQLIELSENIYRNDLNQIDRAVFVLRYREIMEEKFGKIGRGGDRKSKGHDAPLIFAPGREVAKIVQERLGYGPDKYKRAVRIGQNLRPELRNRLRGTASADNLTDLLKLAKLPPEKQVAIADALAHEPDLKKVLAFGKPAKVEVSKHEAALGKLRAAWHAADEEVRAAFLAEIGFDPLEYPEALEAAE